MHHFANDGPRVFAAARRPLTSYNKRESSASSATTTTLLGPPSCSHPMQRGSNGALHLFVMPRAISPMMQVTVLRLFYLASFIRNRCRRIYALHIDSVISYISNTFRYHKILVFSCMSLVLIARAWRKLCMNIVAQYNRNSRFTEVQRSNASGFHFRKILKDFHTIFYRATAALGRSFHHKTECMFFPIKKRMLRRGE